MNVKLEISRALVIHSAIVAAQGQARSFDVCDGPPTFPAAPTSGEFPPEVWDEVNAVAEAAWRETFATTMGERVSRLRAEADALESVIRPHVDALNCVGTITMTEAPAPYPVTPGMPVTSTFAESAACPACSFSVIVTSADAPDAATAASLARAQVTSHMGEAHPAMHLSFGNAACGLCDWKTTTSAPDTEEGRDEAQAEAMQQYAAHMRKEHPEMEQQT